MSIEVMKQALEAVESWQKTCLDFGRASDELGRATKAITALRQAIEEEEKREWVGLTDEDEIAFEWERVTGHSIFDGDPWECRYMFLCPIDILEFVEAIEAKLRKKNMEVEE